MGKCKYFTYNIQVPEGGSGVLPCRSAPCGG